MIITGPNESLKFMSGCRCPEKHPDKNFIGRIERGFDFLGYRAHPLRRLVIGVPRFLL
jgi:hypothetical protein